MVAVAVTVVAVAGPTACSTDAADQKVIERLSKLDVMTVPAGATELSRTSSKGGGNSVIRNASGIDLVYATTQEPAEVGRDFHARVGQNWRLIDLHGAPAGGWKASGALASDPGTITNILARPPAPGDKAPAGSRSVVTVSVSATRPA